MKSKPMKKYIPVLTTVILLAFCAAVLGQTVKQKKGSNMLYAIIQKDGIEQAVKKFTRLQKMNSGEYDLGESEINKLGYKLLNEDNLTSAEQIFDLNVEYHPESINALDSRNDAYMALGKYEEAAKAYQKILSMLEEQDLPPRQERRLKSKAQTNLYRVKHFVPPSKDAFNYISFYGGIPAGKWDMENVAGFNRKHPDLPVSYTGNNLYFRPIPGNTEETFNSSNPTDIATGFIGGYLTDFIRQGDITDISDLWNSNNWDEVFPKAFTRLSGYNGKQYFVPMAYQWNPVWYRKDIFDKHGLNPPKSWKELLSLCDRLNELGYAPFSISVQNWPPPVARWFSILDLRLNGPDFHQQVSQGEVSFKNERIRNVFEHWQTLFRHHAFPDSSYTYNYTNGIQAFTSGKAVMYNLGEWLFESLNEEQAKELDFFVFPPMKPGIPSAEIVHVYGAYMTNRSTHPAGARAMLAYLGSRSSQQSNVTANHRIVANSRVDSSLYTPVQRRIIKQMNHTDQLVPLFEFSTKPAFGRKALRIFQEFWKDPEDIDGTLVKLEKARREVFGM
ncbi:MAG: extracellular solute-binding protein [Balneolaceae bacterium]|jgi:ABC-type glycerol-3-phosphate transport system substrate-binding protein